MSRFRVIMLLALAAVATGAVATAGLRAQAPAAAQPQSTNDLLEALLAETRGLRAEIAESNRIGVRSQLLVARVQLQEQRLMHLDRQRSDVTTKRAQAEQMRQLFAGQMKQFACPAENAILATNDDIGPLCRQVRDQLKAIQAGEAAMRAEEEALLNQIASEQARWTEFNSRLDELERSIPTRR